MVSVLHVEPENDLTSELNRDIVPLLPGEGEGDALGRRDVV